MSYRDYIIGKSHGSREALRVVRQSGGLPGPGHAPASPHIEERDPGAGLPKCLTVEEVAEVLRCSRRTVQRMVTSGKLTGYRVGGRAMLIPEASLAELLERSRV